MARTRTTIRRIDPWSVLKFGFVANLVLLGIQLLAGAVLWYVVQRLELIQTVCELAATVGFEECGVDGGALFDTFLVLGLLGVVIQTGILVFLAFLANLIFDLTGGIGITLEDDQGPARTSVGARSMRSDGGTRSGGSATRSGTSSSDGRPATGVGTSASDGASGSGTGTGTPSSSSNGPGDTSRSRDDDRLFGDR